MFKHPKYYKELRKRNKSDQSISSSPDGNQVERSTGPGLKLQAPSSSKNKQQASSSKLIKK